MDEFIFLVRGYDYTGVSAEVMQKRMGVFNAWKEKMVQAGRYKGGQPLEPGTGRLVKDKKTVLTDGPFLESKEIVGGYCIMLAKDFEEAVAFAKENPLLEHSQLEIRKLGNM
jgi:hypothetical protein